MTVTTRNFASHEGRRVDAFTLRSDTGVEVKIIGFGVIVRDWRVPVAGGAPRSVVLGFEAFPPYLTDSPHFGALAGRVANRIAGAAFELDGTRHQLTANDGANSLHGGPGGLGRVVWDGAIDSAANAVRFTHFSPAGAMGYPGNVQFSAVYGLVGNRLRLDLAATTDARTPISVVQHQYFNLGSGPDILDHRFAIAANAYTETGGDLVPTGAILPVAGTKYDLRTPRTLRDAAGAPLTYDINLVLDAGRDTAEPVAVVTAPDGALTLKLRTDQPGVQFYNGVYTNVTPPGLGGRHYGQFSGFCVEDQAFPDALHQAHFPNIIAAPGRPYSHWSEIEIA